jgi:hypothetical protein
VQLANRIDAEDFAWKDVASATPFHIPALYPVRAALGVNALFRQPQAFYRPAVDQVLFDNLRSILRPYMAIPNRFGIDHHRRPMLALVKTAGFVDAHLGAQPGSLGQLRQLGMKFALSIGCAGWARGAFRADVMTNKNMMFK